ncbi:MAG: DUF2254 domain-containing protein [Myxococcota bacterium]
MIERWRYVLGELSQKLWIRSGLFVMLGIAVVPLSIVAEPLIPTDLAFELGSDAVGSILTVLASSPLAVTTFSLSTMLQAAAAVMDDTTPRAAKLLLDDRGTQNALAAFVGAFMYSLVGIIVLRTGVLNVQGRLVLLATTMLVVVLLVIILLRWIDLLSRIARIDETLDRVEDALRDALSARRRDPHLGGSAPGEIPTDAVPLVADRIGHVSYVDVEALSRVAEAHGAQVHLVAPPGTHVMPPQPLLWYEPGADRASLDDLPGDERRRLLRALVIKPRRTFDQDPRFGMVVLAQIASRAMSPAVNDPGTAIDAVDVAVRALGSWVGVDCDVEPRAPRFPRVLVPALTADDLLDDLVPAVGRDGAGNVAVASRLLEVLVSLAALHPVFEAPARRHAQMAVERALHALTLPQDREIVRASGAPLLE